MLKRNYKLANDIDHLRRTPLHHACRAGNLSLIQILIDFGGNIFTSDEETKRSPLDEAFRFTASNDFKGYSSKIIEVLEEAQSNNS
jgi:ankyrin repeat protein